MMQLGNTFQGQKCARCRQAIPSDPAFADNLWFHRTCLEEGERALHRAQKLAVRFGFEAQTQHVNHEPLTAWNTLLSNEL
jgi:hypothetical protein